LPRPQFGWQILFDPYFAKADIRTERTPTPDPKEFPEPLESSRNNDTILNFAAWANNRIRQDRTKRDSEKKCPFLNRLTV
jgi:hypothetical protein